MHHSWWSYNKTATPRRQENPHFSRETELIDSYVWVSTTTLLCSIFLPVLVKAIPCIGKDLGMCTVAYASLMVELQQDAKTREHLVWVSTTTLLSQQIELIDSCLRRRENPQYFEGNQVYYSIFITFGVTTRPLPCCALFSCQCLSEPSHSYLG